jgi:hypothetical protein
MRLLLLLMLICCERKTLLNIEKKGTYSVVLLLAMAGSYR